MADRDRVQTPDATPRRTVLRGALIAGIATPLLAACGSSGSDNSSSAPTGKGGSSSSSGSGGSAGSGGGTAAKDLTTTAAIPEGSGKIFNADGVVVTQPKPGEFKAFTNICTHMGCPVHDVTNTINCTCHGSQYSITDGSVVTGPATQPLAPKQLKVSGKDISLA